MAYGGYRAGSVRPEQFRRTGYLGPFMVSRAHFGCLDRGRLGLLSGWLLAARGRPLLDRLREYGYN